MDFEEFARRYVGDLICLGMAMTGTQQDAEDFAQSALERLFVRWDDVQRARNPWAYARRTAVNVFLADRRRLRVREVVMPAALRAPPTVGSVDAEWGDGVIDEAISRLPSQQRATVVLRYLEDLGIAEIAEILEVEESTVRGYLARAMAAIRQDCYPSAKGSAQ